MRYELLYYIPEDSILHSHRNVSPMRYELGLIPEDCILHSHRRDTVV
jgi:hypothetical protein